MPPHIYRQIDAWRNRRIEGQFAYLFLDGVVLKGNWAGEVRNISVLVAIGVGGDGHRQILGVAEGEKEDLDGWRSFLHHLQERGLVGVQLIISDARLALLEAVAESYPTAQWQRCVARFYRSVFVHVPKGEVVIVERMLKAIHAQEDRRSAEDKVREVTTKLKAMRLLKAADLVGATAHETLTYFAFPSNHWRQIKTNDPLERIVREMRRRTKVVGAFPDGQSALMLVAARLRHIASMKWRKRRYLAMETLHPVPKQAVA